MSNESPALYETPQRRGNTRSLLLLPPLLLVLAAAVLILASPLAWGAGEIIDAPAWMAPLMGVIVGLGGLWVGLFSLRKTLRSTRGDFEVFGLQTVFGVLMFISGSVMLVSLATQLPSESTYARALDDDGQIQISALGFFASSMLLGAFQIGWVWIGAYLYSNAIDNQAPNRISARHPDEVDGVGVLLRER